MFVFTRAFSQSLKRGKANVSKENLIMAVLDDVELDHPRLAKRYSTFAKVHHDHQSPNLHAISLTRDI